MRHPHCFTFQFLMRTPNSICIKKLSDLLKLKNVQMVLQGEKVPSYYLTRFYWGISFFYFTSATWFDFVIRLQLRRENFHWNYLIQFLILCDFFSFATLCPDNCMYLFWGTFNLMLFTFEWHENLSLYQHDKKEKKIRWLQM